MLHINNHITSKLPIPICIDQPFIVYHAVKNNLYDKSLIIFLSDHGDFTGDYGLVEKTQNGLRALTGLKTSPSKKTNLQESGLDLKTRLAPPKSAANDEKIISATDDFSEDKFWHRKN